MDCYIQTQAVQKQSDEEPRIPARLTRRRARRAPRVQPAIHTVMKITQQHLARIYGSALRCGVSPSAAQARINMLIQDARDEGLLPGSHPGGDAMRRGDESPDGVEVSSMASFQPPTHEGNACLLHPQPLVQRRSGDWRADAEAHRHDAAWRADAEAHMHDAACRVVRLAAGMEALSMAGRGSAPAGPLHPDGGGSGHTHGIA